MASSNGVLDVTNETAQEALADAFLAAGQPSNPTPAQAMEIVADAIKRAEQTPVDAVKQFQALLSKALTFAKENHISLAATEQTWAEAIGSLTDSWNSRMDGVETPQ
jgi:HAMP domain-containing protein